MLRLWLVRGRDVTVRQIVDELQVALALDDNDSDVHRILAAVTLAAHHDHDKAFFHQERALALTPTMTSSSCSKAKSSPGWGAAEEGIEWIRKAMRLNPYHPERFWSHLARAYFAARRYDDAIKAFQRIGHPDNAVCAALAACHAAHGDDAAAKDLAREVLRRVPNFCVDHYLATQHYKQPSDLEHCRAALLKAGLPPTRSRAPLTSGHPHSFVNLRPSFGHIGRAKESPAAAQSTISFAPSLSSSSF